MALPFFPNPVIFPGLYGGTCRDSDATEQPSALLGSYRSNGNTGLSDYLFEALPLLFMLAAFIAAGLSLILFESVQKSLLPPDQGQCLEGHYYIRDWEWERDGKLHRTVKVAPYRAFSCDKWERPAR